MIRIIGLVLLLFLVSPWQVFAAPRVVVEQPNYDFGEVVQGEPVSYIFRFQNNGDQILELGNVQTSCGCTAALLSTRRLAPGDNGELQVKFDSSRFQGEVHKTISLETNDPQNQQVVFNLTGKVLVEVIVVPERINWGLVAAGKQLESVVTIGNRGRVTINLTAPQFTSKNLTAELSARQLAPGGKVELRVKGKLVPGIERLSGYVLIDTDYKNVPQIRVPVTAHLAK